MQWHRRLVSLAAVSAAATISGAPEGEVLLETRQHVYGQWTVTQIIESEGPFVDPAGFFRLPLSEVRRACAPGEAGRISDDGMLVFANQIILIQGPGVTLLVDMGSGNDKQRPDEPWMDRKSLPYSATLQHLGVSLDAVDDVVLTHLHSDHVGLATTLVDGRWVPTFPRARYLASQADWDHFSSLPVAARHPSFDDSVRPLRGAGVLDLVTPRTKVAGLHLHGSNAHTPGMLLVEINDQNVWFVGDLFHHPAQIARPEWRSSTYDVHPERVEGERRRFFSRWADTGAVVFAAHVGQPYRIARVPWGGFAGRLADRPEAE